MWQLALGPGESYPERPDEADCSYYLRTGICGYGSRCRYNHPRDRSAVIFLLLVFDSVQGLVWFDLVCLYRFDDVACDIDAIVITASLSFCFFGW